MTIDTQQIMFRTGTDGTPFATVNGQTYTTFSELLSAAPDMSAPSLARALNHFDPKGSDYSLIRDPDAFQQRYKAQYERAESAPLDPNNPDISNFPMPDLSQIRAPELMEAEIVFYATLNGLGVPYRVSGPADGRAELTYLPL